MDKIPEAIFPSIQSFLSHDDYHYFVNTSKRLFGYIKRRSIYFHLNAEKSNEYLSDPSFRTLLLSKVENGWNQIRIIHEGSSPSILSSIPIHKVISRDFDLPLEVWGNYQSINTGFPRAVKTFPLLSSGNLKEVEVSLYPDACINLSIFSNLLKFSMTFFSGEDITPLKDIPDLTIRSSPNIKDFSMLGNQEKLQIYDCKGLIDVRSFRNIRKLQLLSCDSLVDVSPLHGIYDLTLQRCLKVKDISGLGGHYRFTLLHRPATKIIGFQSLVHIPHVSILHCDIKDVNVLRYAKSVNVSTCNYIKDVSALASVKELKIDSNVLVTGLQALGSVPNLSLIYRGFHGNLFNDDVVSSLKSVHRLLLGSTPPSAPINLTSLSKLSKNIQHLTLGHDERFSDFINQGEGRHLKHLLSLSLESLNQLVILDEFGEIPSLRFSHCHGIRSLKGLGRNHSVELVDCIQLEDVSSLSTVPIIKIKACLRIDSSCLFSVPHLKISA